MAVLKALVAAVLALAAVLSVLRLTHPLPERTGIVPGRAAPADTAPRLAASLLPLAESHPVLSGVVSLADGRDALVTRVLPARAAQATSYVSDDIWQRDTTGWLLLDELRAAADRGVRERPLPDDTGIPGLDPVLAALTAHRRCCKRAAGGVTAPFRSRFRRRGGSWLCREG